MNVEELRDYFLSKKATSESFPFDDNALVFKVMDKMYGLITLNDADINLKCDPEKAIELREEYDDILPGYHMNKKHWNTISTTGSLSSTLIKEMIDHSYDLVVSKLTRKKKEELNQLTSNSE
ncbi:MmcQ/YjbR family DNA-binding protein [Bacteroidales bacterium]|nr:MmcQ/YjbR family DNA-binding protein [Bacteroidales bacterium]